MNLARSAGYNLLGALLPMVVLLLTIPLIVARLGAEAFGALTLITAIVGYVGVIDLNPSAGVIKYGAEHHARGDRAGLLQVIAAGAWMHAAVALVGAALLWFGAGVLVDRVFVIDAAWRAEAEAALRWSAVVFALGQAQAWTASLPQALQRYDIVGRYDALAGTLVPLATLLAVLAGGALVAIVWARIAAALLHLVLLGRAVRPLFAGARVPAPTGVGRPAGRWRALARFSLFAWLQRLAALTASFADKLLVGAWHSMTALGAFGIAQTLVARLFGLLFRLTVAVFPLASALAARGETERLRTSSLELQRYTLAANVALALLLALFARELLHVWLQGRAPPDAALVLVLLAAAALADAVTQVPSLVNDGLGRPQHTAAFALLRALLGVAAAALALAWGGVVALAAAQAAVAVVVGVGFVAWVHARSLPWRWRPTWRAAYGPSAPLAACGALLVAWHWQHPPLDAGAFILAVLGAAVLLAAYGWLVVLLPDDRERLRRWLRRRPVAP